MKTISRVRIWAVAALILLGSAHQASAMKLSGEGAASFNANNYGFISTPSAMVAGELTFGLPLLDLGFVYDHNFLSYQNNGGSGGLNFYGAIGRLTLPFNLFADAQAGAATRDSAGTNFSWGVGAGIEFPVMPMVTASPRISYRSLPDSGVGRNLLDVGLLVTISIL